MAFLYIIFLLFQSSAFAQRVDNKVITLSALRHVNVSYVAYKRHTNVGIAKINIYKTLVNTSNDCGLICKKNVQCDGFSWMKDDNARGTSNNCRLFHGNLDTNHYYVFKSTNFDFYEIQNECTKHPGICEHGSVCIPNFNNNTYFCQWCFPPFTGKHCNESGVNTEAINQDILSGKNSSCHSLAKYFGDFVGPRVIHPWRDERHLTMLCDEGGTTVVASFTESSTGSLTTYHPLNALDTIGGGHFRVTTDFLNTLYKLTKFKYFKFLCKRNNGSLHTIKTSNVAVGDDAVVDLLKYFIGESDKLPSACGNSDVDDCVSVQDGVWSFDEVDYQFRYLIKVLMYVNGKGFSIGQIRFKCFDDEFTSYNEGDLFKIVIGV